MRRIAFVVVVLLLALARPAAQQGLTLVWDMENTPAWEAQSYTYRAYLDEATTGVILQGVICRALTGTLHSECTVPLFSVTNGVHTLQLSAENYAAEGDKSAVLTFRYPSGKPPTPQNLRIVK